MAKEHGNKFDINKVMQELKNKRRVFVSEADFQLEMAMIIKELYNVEVRLEYPFIDIEDNDDDQKTKYIDILVLYKENGESKPTGIPIELKYKTKGCTINLENHKLGFSETYDLREHSAKDYNCYYYFKDINRIEKIRDNGSEYKFAKGYAIFLTNDLCYTKKARIDADYKEFSLHGSIKDLELLDSLKKNKKICEYEDDITITKSEHNWSKKEEKGVSIGSNYDKEWQWYSTINESEITKLDKNKNYTNKIDDVKTFIYLTIEIKDK